MSNVARRGRLGAGAALVTAVALLAAGCGGSGSSAYYNPLDVRDCLQEHGGISNVETPTDLGFAPSGSEGNVTFENAGGDEVVLTFGRDSSEAKENADAVKRTAGAFGGGDVDDAVRAKGNVAYWATGTDPNALAAAEDCL